MRKETFDAIASRLVGLDAEHLKEVKYEPASDTLTGIVRNPRKEIPNYSHIYQTENLTDEDIDKEPFLDYVIRTCQRNMYVPKTLILTNIPSE